MEHKCSSATPRHCEPKPRSCPKTCVPNRRDLWWWKAVDLSKSSRSLSFTRRLCSFTRASTPRSRQHFNKRSSKLATRHGFTGHVRRTTVLRTVERSHSVHTRSTWLAVFFVGPMVITVVYFLRPLDIWWGDAGVLTLENFGWLCRGCCPEVSLKTIAFMAEAFARIDIVASSRPRVRDCAEGWTLQDCPPQSPYSSRFWTRLF